MPTALLWHLHQPEYRDPDTGRPVMPWTRLHALRGYRDLFVESIESGVPWTLNVVPGLWSQLLHYAYGGDDGHLALTRIPADALSAADRAEVLHTFPCGNPTMRNTPRYRAIEQLIHSGQPDVAAVRDLQVLSTLVWCGSTLLRDHPELQALVDKGAGYSEDDKQVLLGIQDAALRGFPELLRRLAQTEGPRLSTTPLHHPILPLLVDLSHAARSVGSPPTAELRRPDHALQQLVEGRQMLEEAAGTEVRGCWPSEGAVSPEVLPLVAEAGFRWLATDEGILERSKRSGAGEGGWDLGHGLVGFFRDRALSDRIGFDYARWQQGAVEDFLGRAVSDGVKLVALDGENPWESFVDAGRSFREGIIAGLLKTGITLDEAAEREPVGRVERLHTGSWIGANLEIWAGADEDHEAWSLLAAAVHTVGDDLDARPHLLAAEGSDWFWWYGPEFDTPFAGTFDLAFRRHLTAAYEAAGEPVPEALNRSLTGGAALFEAPARALHPEHGEPGWFGAGRWRKSQGSMARGDAASLEFGWDLAGAFWLRVPDGEAAEVDGQTVTGTACLGDRASVQVRFGATERTLQRVDWVV